MSIVVFFILIILSSLSSIVGLIVYVVFTQKGVTTAEPVTPVKPVTTADPVTPVNPVTTADPVTPVKPANTNNLRYQIKNFMQEYINGFSLFLEERSNSVSTKK